MIGIALDLEYLRIRPRRAAERCSCSSCGNEDHQQAYCRTHWEPSVLFQTIKGSEHNPPTRNKHPDHCPEYRAVPYPLAGITQLSFSLLCCLRGASFTGIVNEFIQILKKHKIQMMMVV